MRSGSAGFFEIISLVLILGSTALAVKWLGYKLGSTFERPWLRDYRELAFISTAAVLLVVLWMVPSYDSPRRAAQQVVLLVILGTSLPLIAFRARHRLDLGRLLPKWADSHGFTVVCRSPAGADETLPEDLRRLPLFRRGSGAARFVLERNAGNDGLHTLIFDYERLKTILPWWMAEGSTGRQARCATVIAIRQPKLRLPPFELRPVEVAEEPLVDDPPWLLLDLPQYPRFTADYTLYAKDLASPRRVFSHDMATALERDPTWCLEGLGEWFVTYHYDRPERFWTLRPRGLERVEPDKLSLRLETALRLFHLATNPS